MAFPLENLTSEVHALLIYLNNNLYRTGRTALPMEVQ
jgi:hypothetical protein